ncbi:prepilin-type N-terminal cleavage/methylation domain-containing protein [Patescibacteria group bacterium]|nr:MAG: prepilin-type N-terminal cleavage/methylation domain-containing protein [Patescibacteria group bacterium]
MQGGEIRTERKQKGFTLIELLIIIGIIGILFAVILVAVDPARRFAEARNAVRRQDVRDVVEAVLEYMKDNRNTFPKNIDALATSYQMLGTATTGCNATACAGIPVESLTAACSDLTSDLVETYLAEIPMDPNTGTAENTRYAINKTSGNRIEVIACDSELGVTTIRAKR